MMVKFNDNSEKAMAMLQANARAALAAMGEEAVGATVKQMQSGYGKPIRQTGNLMGSIAHAKSGDMTEDVGTNVEYATFVHEGTSRMAGRPYLKDGITGAKNRLQKVAEVYLKKGFE